MTHPLHFEKVGGWGADLLVGKVFYSTKGKPVLEVLDVTDTHIVYRRTLNPDDKSFDAATVQEFRDLVAHDGLRRYVPRHNSGCIHEWVFETRYRDHLGSNMILYCCRLCGSCRRYNATTRKQQTFRTFDLPESADQDRRLPALQERRGQSDGRGLRRSPGAPEDSGGDMIHHVDDPTSTLKEKP